MTHEELLLCNQRFVTVAAKRTLPPGWELDDWISEINMKVWRGLRNNIYDPERGTITTWVMSLAFRHSSACRRDKSRAKRVRPIAYRPASFIKSFQPQKSLELDIGDALEMADEMIKLYAQSVLDSVKLHEFAERHHITLRHARYLKTKVRKALETKLKSYGTD